MRAGTTSEGPVQGRTVLITGGAGFIGHHLAQSLVSDNEIAVLDDFSTGREERLPDGVRVIRGDVRDDDAVGAAMQGVDLVVHLAAIVDVARSVAEPQHCHSVNVDGTLTVLEAAREADARVVFASSAAVYGVPESVPVPEAAPKDPLSPYGLDKLAADRYVRLYNDLYDLPTVVCRLFNVYGPGQRGGDYSGVIQIFLDQARAGDSMTVHGDGTQTRDFVHVRDVVAAFQHAATTTRVGEAFNIGTGESVAIRELASMVRDRAAGAATVTHTEPREGDIAHSRADIEKAQTHLGYQPTIPLADGLAMLF
jgi:UDP-glucose 4-epimerase